MFKCRSKKEKERRRSCKNKREKKTKEAKNYTQALGELKCAYNKKND